MDGNFLSIFTAIFCFFVHFLNLFILIMGIFLYYFACLVTRYTDVEVNPGHRSDGPAGCWITSANLNGLQGNLDELTLAAL